MKKSPIDIFTFGSTPACQYLSRILNERNPAAVKACAVRAQTFNNNVNGIERAVTDGQMTAHVAANLLRLLRDDATRIEFNDMVEGKFIAQLLRNVIIGNIKRAIRRVTTLRKIENGNVNSDKITRKASVMHVTKESTQYSILGYPAGVLYNDGKYYRQYPEYCEIKDETTPELLMERSNRRCLRQGKPHMANNIVL
jgi:hypothetical protein